MMAHFGPYFFDMIRHPERVKCLIRAAYKRFGRMQDVATHLGVSVAQLRVHCRQLEIDPPREARLEKEEAELKIRTTGKTKQKKPRAKRSW